MTIGNPPPQTGCERGRSSAYLCLCGKGCVKRRGRKGSIVSATCPRLSINIAIALPRCTAVKGTFASFEGLLLYPLSDRAVHPTPHPERTSAIPLRCHGVYTATQIIRHISLEWSISLVKGVSTAFRTVTRRIQPEKAKQNKEEVLDRHQTDPN
jgi:hypothetical protein